MTPHDTPCCARLLRQCFIADEEMNDATDRYATSELADFVTTSSKQAAEKAMKAKAKGEKV